MDTMENHFNAFHPGPNEPGKALVAGDYCMLALAMLYLAPACSRV